jgi:hypothetical protein
MSEETNTNLPVAPPAPADPLATTYQGTYTGDLLQWSGTKWEPAITHPSYGKTIVWRYPSWVAELPVHKAVVFYSDIATLGPGFRFGAYEDPGEDNYGNFAIGMTNVEAEYIQRDFLSKSFVFKKYGKYLIEFNMSVTLGNTSPMTLMYKGRTGSTFPFGDPSTYYVVSRVAGPPGTTGVLTGKVLVLGTANSSFGFEVNTTDGSFTTALLEATYLNEAEIFPP